MVCKLHFYTDRALLSSVPSGVRSHLRSRHLATGEGSRANFCGVITTENGAHIFFPRNTELPEHGSREGYRLASFIMRAIRRYTADKTSMEYADDEGHEEVNGHRLGLIHDLLDDFYQNGLYSRRLSERVINTGKPDWKRTLCRHMPFPGSGGPIYLNIEGVRRRYVSGCEIARIHAMVIRELDEAFGWIISGSDRSISSDICAVPVPKGNTGTWKASVEKELSQTYSDRDIRLLEMLSEFLIDRRGDSSNNAVIGIRHFHGMWEHMLDRSLQWNFPVNRLLSVPAYRLDDGQLVAAPSKGQRTDTVLHREGSKLFAVVDAKYYGAKGIGSAPGWPDLVKQFFYAKALSVYKPGARINNVFVFPGSGPLRSVHMIERSNKALQDEHYPPIKCTYVDPVVLMEHYVKGTKMKDLSEELLSEQVFTATL